MRHRTCLFYGLDVIDITNTTQYHEVMVTPNFQFGIYLRTLASV